MLKNQIKQQLSKGIQELYGLQIAEEGIQVDNPSLEKFGDYTSNIALTVTKTLPKEDKQSPLEIAKKLVEYLIEHDKDKNYEKVEAILPGFINITLSERFLISWLNQPVSHRILDQGPTTLVEYIQPNTNKPLHIGHLRNASLGMALLNIQHANGTRVISANINNDRGIHIIKSMYGYLVHGMKDGQEQQGDYKNLLTIWSQHPEKWHTPESLNMKSDTFVGKFYILGNNDYEASEQSEKESGAVHKEAPHNQMQEMLIEWENENPLIRQLWKQNNDWFYQGLRETLTNFGIKSPNNPAKFFDKEWYESQVYKEGKNTILEKIGNGVIEEFEDGHVEAVLSKYNLPNIVLLRKNKTSLYITQDIELMRQRLQDDKIDKVVMLTGNEQNLRFQQLFAVCESLNIGKLDQMIHFGYGMVRTPEGKMSSRKGTVISADGLLEEVQAKALEKINEERSEYAPEEKADISKKVAIAAIKYGMLKYNPMSNIVFDIESNIAFEGDTGPYLQYTHARAASIERKYKERYGQESVDLSFTGLNTYEKDLIRHLQKYADWVSKSADAYSPNYLCEYLFNLSQKFNLFYNHAPIINEEDSQKRAFRLLVTLKTKSILQSGLSLLGIDAPDRM